MVEVKNLSKRYGGKTALDNVSFSIGGGVVGLLGLNGAGKSTTMNILTGYLSATGGEAAICGHDITSDGKKAKRVTGYLPEQPSFYPEMRVDEHLDFICGLKGVARNKREKHISDICARVGISDMRKRMIRNLSKGYKQRVGFAQALIGNPEVIILDEPTAGLDPMQITEIRRLIMDSGKERTVIVSSHILSEIEAVCSRVIVLNKGKLIADDTPEGVVGKLFARDLTIRVLGEPGAVESALSRIDGIESVKRLSQAEHGAFDYTVSAKSGADVRADIFRALAASDLPLLSSYGAGRSLEEAFLGLVGDKKEDVL